MQDSVPTLLGYQPKTRFERVNNSDLTFILVTKQRPCGSGELDAGETADQLRSGIAAFIALVSTGDSVSRTCRLRIDGEDGTRLEPPTEAREHLT